MAANDELTNEPSASSGDGGKSVDPSAGTVPGTTSGVRQFERVPVALGITLGIGSHDFKTISVDISETGVLIHQYTGEALTVGDRIEVLIKGIIADDDVDEQTSSMIVVRADDDQVALVFDQNPPDKS